LPIQAVRGHALNGLFYTEIGRKFGKVVDEFHELREGRPLPFSLAPIFRDEEFLGVRMGTLTAEFGDIVSEVWGGLAAKCAEVRLGSATLQVDRVKPGGLHPMSYQQLLDEAPEGHGVWLRFEPPMRVRTFNQSGVLPTPQAVWHGYVLRWEAFAGIDLPPEFLHWANRRAQATELQLETRYAFIEKTVEWKGVMGEVEYTVFVEDGDDVPVSRLPDYLRAWQALALLADFCGTGEKTTMGMGRTRRLKVFGRHRTASDSG